MLSPDETGVTNRFLLSPGVVPSPIAVCGGVGRSDQNPDRHKDIFHVGSISGSSPPKGVPMESHKMLLSFLGVLFEWFGGVFLLAGVWGRGCCLVVFS